MLLSAIIRLYVQYRGRSHSCTNISSPCNYETAVEMMNSTTAIYVCDREISERIHLNSFSKFATTALSKGAILNGWNTVVLGRNADDFFPAYLSFDSVESVRLQNLTFAEFHVPIFHTRGVGSASLSQIRLDHCHLDGGLSLFTLAGRAIEFSGLAVDRTTVHDSSVISVHSGVAQFDGCVFTQMFAYHVLPVPLIAVYSANATFANSVFCRNASPRSPLLGIDGVGRVLLENVSFEDGQHSQLFLIDSRAVLELHGDRFHQNMGMIVAAGVFAHVSISKCNFSHNFAGDSPLFQHYRSTFEFYDAVIHGNAGTVIFRADHGVEGRIERVVFEGNRPRAHVGVIDALSRLRISHSVFQGNFVGEAEIAVSSGQLEVENSSFASGSGVVIDAASAEIVVGRSLFTHSAVVKPLVRVEGGKARLFQCNFSGESWGPVLKIQANVQLTQLSFVTTAVEALPPDLASACRGCSFGTIEHSRVRQPIWQSLILWVNAVLLALVCWRARRLRSIDAISKKVKD
jgi:hypothetical protein